MVFGHHYTSIAGTGPIVGPAIGIIWGWVPALIWIFVGSIVMGAVHDFGSLVISLRNEGKSLSEITARYISKRARTLFFLIVFFELLIVIAIFGVIIASIFKQYPEAVIPIWAEVPIAMAIGWAVYRKKANLTLATVVGVLAMYAMVLVGTYVPLEMPAMLGGALPPMGMWVLILLVYAFFASTMPVTMLLQPRDYLNAWQLFIAMGLLLAGIVTAAATVGLPIVAPAYNPSPSGAPPMWPFLCITIACGAISGFHCLVASGTTSKQLRREGDAQFIGFGSMLMEGALAVLVVVAVSAGIGLGYTTKGGETFMGAAAWSQHYGTWTGNMGLEMKLRAFVDGSANMLATIGLPTVICSTIMGVFIASFAGTTLDTATRIQRYALAELARDFKLPGLANRWVATGIAVGTAGALAFATGASGVGAMTLWPMFGAVNQMLAALALLLVSVYLKRRGGWGFLLTLLPCAFMLVMTIWAMVSNQLKFARGLSSATSSVQQWVLMVVNGLTLVLAIALAIEAMVVLLARRASAAQNGPDEEHSAEA